MDEAGKAGKRGRSRPICTTAGAHRRHGRSPRLGNSCIPASGHRSVFSQRHEQLSSRGRATRLLPPKGRDVFGGFAAFTPRRGSASFLLKLPKRRLCTTPVGILPQTDSRVSLTTRPLMLSRHSTQYCNQVAMNPRTKRPRESSGRSSDTIEGKCRCTNSNHTLLLRLQTSSQILQTTAPTVVGP